MKNNRILNRYPMQQSEGIDTKQLISKLIRRWYVFLLFGIMGLALGVVCHKFLQTKYEVRSTVLYKTDPRHAAVNSLFKDMGLDSKKNASIKNQIGILKSYTLNLKTLQNLRWDFSWYKKATFGKIDLFQREPFEIIQKEGTLQLRNVPVRIKPVSEDYYIIEIDEEVEIDGIKRMVKIKEKAAFGKPYENEYFNFTINKSDGRPLDLGAEYFLVFNDLNKLAQYYQNNLKVKLADEDSDLIYIELETTQPERAVSYLNELGEVYIQFGLNEKNRVANNTFTFIDNQIAGVMESLQSAGKDFTNFRSKNRVVNLGQETELVVEKLEEIENEEALGKMKLEYYNNLRRYLKDASQMEDLVAPSVVGVTDPALNAMVLKLNDLYRQREVLSYTVQAKNPNLIQLDREISYTQKVLEENINNLLSNTRLELDNLSQQKQKVNFQLSKLPKTEQDLINIKRSFDLNNELYTFLLQKRAEAGITKASNDPDAQILDPARIDTVAKLGPARMHLALVGLFAGIGLPLLLFVLFDYFDNRLKSVEDVENQLNLPIAGTISHSKFKTELPVIQYPHSAVTESFRGLRTNLQHLLVGENKKVVAVHSTVVGEGKSFVAINLAAILVSNNKKVLLVEADMRKPRLHKLLLSGSDTGLSNYLSGKNSLNEIVISTTVKGLSFVGAGSMSLFPSELLNNGYLQNFVQEAKEHFDYVIFDNPPVGILSDSMLIAPHADINLFVLRLKKTTKEQMRYVAKVADEGVIGKVAIVLNDVTNDSQAFKKNGYGYYNEKKVSKKKMANVPV